MTYMKAMTRQLDGPDGAVPEQHDGQQQGKERHNDRSKIGVALES